MTGWRLGWIVAPERHVRDLEKLAQNLYISPPTPSQCAALACFEPATLAIVEQRRRAFEARRDFLVPALRALGFGIPVHADRRLLRLCRLLALFRRQRAVLPRRAARRGRRDHAGHRLRRASRAASTCASPTRSTSASSTRASSACAISCHDDDRPAPAIARAAHRAELFAGNVAVTPRAAPALAASSSRCSRAHCCWPHARRSRPSTTTGRARQGQRDLLSRAEADPGGDRRAATPRSLTRLPRIREIRAFASRELGLPDNGSYTRYTDLGRPFVAVERVRDARAVADAAAVVLSRSPAASTTAAISARTRRAAKRRASRPPATTSTSAACRPIRRSAGSTTRCCRRSCAGPKPRSRGSSSTSLRTSCCTSRATRRSTSRSPRRSRRRDSRAGSRPGTIRGSRRRLRAPSGCAAYSATSCARRARSSLRPVCERRERRREAAREGRGHRGDEGGLRAREGGRAGHWRATTAGSRSSPNNASAGRHRLYTDRVPAFRELLHEANGDLPAFYDARPRARRTPEARARRARSTRSPRGARRQSMSARNSGR